MELFIGILITDLLFILFWFLMNKARKSQIMKELDNGYEFYLSLDDKDKEMYWKEDTRLVNYFFMTIFVFIQLLILTCVILPFQMIYLYLTILGFILTFVIFVRESLKLQKKYKKQ